LSDDGFGTIRLLDISNIAIAIELKTSLAELGFTNIIMYPTKLQQLLDNFFCE
jgi:hypothetical protein